MKIDNLRSGVFYIATARYNPNTLIIKEVGTYGPLKVLAQKDKYFNSYEPTFMYFNGVSLKKITKATLKKDFQHALRTDPNYFTVNEREKLGNLFKIKIILKPTLQEKKKINVKKRLK